MNRFIALFCMLTLLAADAEAAKRPARRRSPPRKEKVSVPVNLGIGPAGFVMTGPIADDQAMHPGLRINVFAALDKDLILKQIARVPRQARKRARNIRGEIRYSPLWWLPESLILSPQFDNTGIFGINFRPVGIGVALSDAPRFDIGAGLLVSYAYVTSKTIPSPTHFLRPGIELKAELEFPIQQNFRVSVGWSSSLYPPQEVGGEIFKIGELDDSIWHVGQAFLLLHFRFPYEAEI